MSKTGNEMKLVIITITKDGITHLEDFDTNPGWADGVVNISINGEDKNEKLKRKNDEITRKGTWAQTVRTVVDYYDQPINIDDFNDDFTFLTDPDKIKKDGWGTTIDFDTTNGKKAYYKTNETKYELRLIQKMIQVIGQDDDKVELTIRLNSKKLENQEESEMETIQEKIGEVLEHGEQNIVLTGAPGTGKTYAVKQYVAQQLGGEDATWNDIKNDPRRELVQFHQSYDYTDFIEGYRPNPDSPTGGFELKTGIFKEFCERAEKAEESDEKYYFIIDEINRADLSKVFGEVMMGLEDGYRGETIKTQYGSEFTIPNNVIIIGTMNDIDRSVESFDFALRRRFRWIEIDADEYLESTLEEMWESGVPEGLADRIKAVNEVIISTADGGGGKIGLSKDYKIGAAYFKEPKTELGDIDEYLENIWETKINSLLKEYTRGYSLEQVEKFLTKCKEALLNPDAESSDEADE